MPTFNSKDAGKKKAEPLSEAQIQLMLAVAIRDEQVYQQVASQLRVTHFPEDMVHLGAIWRTVVTYYEEFQVLPAMDVLRAEVEQWMQGANNLSDQQIDDMEHTLSMAYSFKKKALAERRLTVISYAKQFLEEALQREVRLIALAPSGMHMPDLLKTLQSESEAIQSLSSGKIDLPFPDDLEQIKPLEKIPTGCEYFDKYMNGGQAANEVYGVCAPYGVGKTTIGIQLSVNRCRYELSQSKLLGREKTPVVYTVMYEEDINSVRYRALSYAAGVPKTAIEEGQWDTMSSRAMRNYKDYERNQFAAAFASGIMPPGEKERLAAARAQLTVNWRPIDFSGAKPEYNKLAGDSVEGIKAIIDKDQMLCGNPGVSLIIIDYASAAADRHCQAYNLKPDAMRPVLSRFPLRVKTQLAANYQCPVWIMQQLNTEANSRQAGVVPRITDVPEARNFAENLAFAFLIGTKTKDSLVVMTNCKQRRAGKLDDTVLFVDGAFSRILGTGNDYRIDNSRIVRASDYDQFVDIEETEEAEPHFERRASNSGLGIRNNPGTF